MEYEDITILNDDGICLSTSLQEETVRRVLKDSTLHTEQDVRRWTSLLKNSASYGGCSTGNRVSLLTDSTEAWREIIKCIDGSTERVWMEVYIFDMSTIAKRIAHALKRAAIRGCDVILVVDYVGSMNMGSSAIKELRNVGVKVIQFNPVYSTISSIFLRDHRKVLITDSIGFSGSLNVSKDCAATRDEEKPHFFDVHAKLEGPCVADLANIFRDSLKVSGANVLRGPIPVCQIDLSDDEEDSYVQILQSNVPYNVRSIQRVLSNVVSQASYSVWIASPYFMPPGFLRRALNRSIWSGADVKVLLSGNSDVPLDVSASTYVAKKLLTKKLHVPGGRSYAPPDVYFHHDQHMHAKFCVVDGLCSFIGSYNWDRYSSRRNLEVVISVFDNKTAKELRRIHDEKVCDSLKFLKSTWRQFSIFERMMSRCAYVAVKVSGKNIMDGLSQSRSSRRRAVQIHNFLELIAAEHISTGMMWGFQ
eukprot:GHVL01026869.1.p1 GENE.GHVL01026869.1~~GHVL01026869.1.p1  ORF type:complete len:476 (-),score=46.77 GHVL01026869.1:3089-4516(-)